MSRDLVAIGKLVKAFGIQGHLVVLPMTDALKRFRRLSDVFIGTDAAVAVEQHVERAIVEQRGVRLKIAGVNDRTAAEQLVGAILFVEERHSVRLPKGRYFIHQIVGMAVVDETRGPVGTVRDVLKLPAHDVYVVAYRDKEYMIPAVKEFIRRIDVPAGQITVRLIEGMIDEEAGDVA